MVVKQGKEIAKILYQGKRVTDIYKQGEILFPNMRGLMPDTKNAIIDTLGTDAWMQTLDYVRQKPELVPFINEDPMLVYSLVETNKKRYLYPDKVGNYFDTGFNAKVAPTCEVLMTATNNNNTDYWGNSPKGNACYYADFTTKLQFYRYGSSSAIDTGVALPIGESHLWSVGKEIKLDGQLRYTTNNTYIPDESQASILIFRSHRGSSNAFKLAVFRIYDGEELVQTFVPFKRNGQLELLDIVTLRLATRVGTFTEVIE